MIAAMAAAAVVDAKISNDSWWDSHVWTNGSLELQVTSGHVSGTTDATD